MFVIETAEGRFEGTTEKEAKSALRKAQAASRKQRVQTAANYNRAREIACLNGYQLLARKLSEGNCQRSFFLAEPGKPCGPKIVERGEYLTKFVLETRDGHATIDFWGYTPLFAICSNSGYAIGLISRDDTTREIECRAIGVQGESWSWVELPGITIEDFREV